MAKTLSVNKKTHAYLLPEYDNIVVRAISEQHVTEYEKDGIQVYSCDATVTSKDGTKNTATNYYVNVTEYVKRTATRQSSKDAILAKLAGLDLSGKSIDDIRALLG